LSNGLEGIVVAETETSSVNADAGELIIRGFPIGELSGSVTFEQVCSLLWHGKLDAGVDLGAARVAAFEKLPSLGRALAMSDAMDAMRAATAQLEGSGHVEVTGALAVFSAAWARAARGRVAVAPDPTQSHASDYLRMIHGKSASPHAVAAMDAYLTAVVDHGMNASTFAARVVTSTESDLVSSVVAALGALKGRLHGGAPGPVLDMLDAVGSPERAATWVDAELAAGRRIMGMGHRVYRVRDPRAAVLETALERLTARPHGPETEQRLRLARTVERCAEQALTALKPDRVIRANVEFYTAVLLEALGLPRTLFTATFACSRVAGWSAHVQEQRTHGRLIRPRARYVGPTPASA